MRQTDVYTQYRRAASLVVPQLAKRVPYLVRRRAVPLLDGNVRHMTERLRGLEGKYKGQRCFLMGNGPSLNKMNLELFRNEHIWGSNRCYLLFDRISWRPTFFIAVDTRVVPDIAMEINDLSRDLPQTTFFFPLLFREQSVLRSRPNVYWYREVARRNTPDGMFSQDPSERVVSVRTVTVAALQLAVYLGFNPIYLIGCDTSYSKQPTAVIRPSVQTEKVHSALLTATKDDDHDHFDPRYFGKGRKFHEPFVEKMIFHYQQAKIACDSMGVKVFNATVGGNLEVFPRVNYEELF